jgi:nucleotide-binding universal stress UspA family protein
MLRILLPVDQSPATLAAVRHVMQLAHHGLAVHVVLAHVEPEPGVLEVITVRDPEVLAGATSGAAESAFGPAEELLKGMNIPYERDLSLGDPARVLLEVCERCHCRLIVIGSAERGDLHSVFFGSVSHAVANKAQVPVTLVHPRDAAQAAPV